MKRFLWGKYIPLDTVLKFISDKNILTSERLKHLIGFILPAQPGDQGQPTFLSKGSQP
jgi:hypothetical protein